MVASLLVRRLIPGIGGPAAGHIGLDREHRDPFDRRGRLPIEIAELSSSAVTVITGYRAERGTDANRCGVLGLERHAAR